MTQRIPAVIAAIPRRHARRSFRNDGYADIVSNHSADGIEASETDAQFDWLSCLNGVLPDMLLKRVCSCQANKFVVEHGSKGLITPVGGGMTSRRD